MVETQKVTMTDFKTMTETMTSVRFFYLIKSTCRFELKHCTDRYCSYDGYQDDDRLQNHDRL
jgi:hypothetical protein